MLGQQEKRSKLILLFRKLLAALKKKKTFNFSFCKSFVDFVATIMKMMLFSLRARHCKYFGTKDFSNKKIKRNKQREKQEFCTKPKNSKTAKTMSKPYPELRLRFCGCCGCGRSCGCGQRWSRRYFGKIPQSRENLEKIQFKAIFFSFYL